MARLNITYLRTHLRKAIEQVRAGEDIEIVQNGVVVAALVSPERLRPRIVTPNTRRAEALVKEIQAHRHLILTNPDEPLGMLSPAAAAKLLAEVAWHRVSAATGFRHNTAALHLACAVHAGADAFVTNNRKDFRQDEVPELQVLYV